MLKLPKNVKENDNLGFFPAIIEKGTEKILIGRWIGVIEVVVDGHQDEDGVWEYITDYFLAYQTINGKVVYVDGPIDGVCPLIVHSLKGTLHDIKWGFYPDNFPKEWQYCVSAPVANLNIEAVEEDELPF